MTLRRLKVEISRASLSETLKLTEFRYPVQNKLFTVWFVNCSFQNKFFSECYNCSSWNKIVRVWLNCSFQNNFVHFRFHKDILSRSSAFVAVLLSR